ncbi:MAG: carbohydrate ABC transporter permease [Christensenellales bacterium]|jgi:putative aldouronate transport system permease protein
MTAKTEKKISVAPTKLKLSTSDRIYYTIVYGLIFFLTLIVIYPLIFVVSSSFSSGQAVTNGRVVFLPVEPSVMSYQKVFEYRVIWTGYRNTIIYTVVGTIWNVAMTVCAAYALSRPTLPGRGWLTFLFAFTALFSGGLIPSFLLIRDLGMYNTPWALIIPGAVSVYNMVITRTFFQNTIPYELNEAAVVDGCSDFRFFFAILLPLSKAVIAVITLYYAVGHWNSYFPAMLYLNNRNLWPLQLFLREILIQNQFSTEMLSTMTDEEIYKLQGMSDLLKYAFIVVATVPILFVYPFIQKYFTKGVMIGSLKG